MANLNGNYREFTLDNGLFVALQNTPTETIAGRLRVFHGGLHEQKGEEGLAHFVEHTIMAGGTEKYSPKDVETVRGTLGYLNACTSPSGTEFPVNMLAEDVELYLDFISEVAFYPRFDKKKVEEERNRVLREMADYKSRPDFKDIRAFYNTMFGEKSPHNYFTLGKEEVVANATSGDLQRFHTRGYNAANMDLVLVGALPEDIEDIIKKKFEDKVKGNKNKFIFPRNQALDNTFILNFLAPDLYNHENPEASSAYIRIGLVGPTEADEDHYALKMLVQILGLGPTSRLFKTISQERGLAYHIGGGYDFSDNKGAVYVHGNVAATKTEEALDAIFAEMKKLQTEVVAMEELKRLQRDSKFQLANILDSNRGHVDVIETKIDRNLTPEIYFYKLSSVTPEQIQDAANKYLLKSRDDEGYVLLLRNPLKK